MGNAQKQERHHEAQAPEAVTESIPAAARTGACPVLTLHFNLFECILYDCLLDAEVSMKHAQKKMNWYFYNLLRVHFQIFYTLRFRLAHRPQEARWRAPNRLRF